MRSTQTPEMTTEHEFQRCDYRAVEFERAWPTLEVRAGFKQQLDDFMVDEYVPFELSGSGEHLWLLIRKRACNTDWVAQQLAKHTTVKPVAVGYAGLKDRHGVTTQWFSIHLPGRDNPDLSALWSDQIELIQSIRHSKKLQRGALSHNRFEIRLRNVDQQEQVAERCQQIASEGVPNYFGEQRFGRNRDNLKQAERMFASRRSRLSRQKRSIYLSAARSWLFNEMLSQRVQDQTWNRRMEGDVFMLDGKSACFRDDGSSDLDARLRAGEIHPSGAMWGDGESMSSTAVRDLEQAVAVRYPELSNGLVAARVESQRRALRLMPRNMQWRFEGQDCVLCFDLPAGAYATTVLRELVELEEPSRFSEERGRIETNSR